MPRIWQTDIVPSISLALAIPIPFCNLGAVLPALMPSAGNAPQDAANMLSAVHNNAAQVLHFLATYQNATRGSLPVQLVHTAHSLYHRALRSLPQATEEKKNRQLAASAESSAREAPHAGTQFTCFTSKNVPMLTNACVWPRQQRAGHAQRLGSARSSMLQVEVAEGLMH